MFLTGGKRPRVLFRLGEGVTGTIELLDAVVESVCDVDVARNIGNYASWVTQLAVSGAVAPRFEEVAWRFLCLLELARHGAGQQYNESKLASSIEATTEIG